MNNKKRIITLLSVFASVFLMSALRECEKDAVKEPGAVKPKISQQVKKYETQIKQIDQKLKTGYEKIDSLNAAKLDNLNRIEAATGTEYQTGIDTLFNF